MGGGGGRIKERSSSTRGEKTKERNEGETRDREEVGEKGAWTTVEKTMNGHTREKEEEVRETNKHLRVTK